MSEMKRVILHWTAGADGVIGVESDAYHYIVGRDGTVTRGQDPIAANVPPLVPGQYAAHTRGCNSYSIGVSLDAMAGARERPFDPGRYPITETQLDAMAKLVAQLCADYAIPVTRRTVLTHAEVQPTLGIPQKNKWDITWLPGMAGPGDPVVVGDVLRQRIARAKGSKGEWVRELQEALRDRGFTLRVDGDFGPATALAVRDWQKRAGLDVDGRVGPATWASLAEAAPAGVSAPAAASPAPQAAPPRSGDNFTLVEWLPEWLRELLGR